MNLLKDQAGFSYSSSQYCKKINAEDSFMMSQKSNYKIIVTLLLWSYIFGLLYFQEMLECWIRFGVLVN